MEYGEQLYWNMDAQVFYKPCLEGITLYPFQAKYGRKTIDFYRTLEEAISAAEEYRAEQGRTALEAAQRETAIRAPRGAQRSDGEA